MDNPKHERDGQLSDTATPNSMLGIRKLSIPGRIAHLTPWIGPHADQYVPVGQVLSHADAENADCGFWVIAAVA